jgi:hypothetical protein
MKSALPEITSANSIVIKHKSQATEEPVDLHVISPAAPFTNDCMWAAADGTVK